MLLIFLALVVVIVFRILYSTPIEFNDESISKWETGRIILETGKWKLLFLDHHNLRWSVVVPQILLATIFGEGYASYYITPIAFFSLVSIASIFLLRPNRHWWLLSVTLVIVISFEPLSHAMASQVNSGSFGLFYALTGVFLVLAYEKTTHKRYIVLSSLFFFFAYGAHVTYLTFSVAPFLFFIINRRDYKAAVVFSGILLLLFIAESLIFWWISQGEAVGGRLEKLWETKRSGSTLSKGHVPYELHHFLDRWRMLPKVSLLITILFIVCCLSLVSRQMRKSVPSGIWMCGYAATIYCIAISVPIIGFYPLRLVLELHSRYVAPFFPLAAVVVIWSFSYFFRNYSNRFRILLFGGGVFVFSIVFLGGSWSYQCGEGMSKDQVIQKYGLPEEIYCKLFRYSQEQNVYPSPDLFMLRAQDYYSSFSDSYIKGDVALFGLTRTSAFTWFVRVRYPDAQFLETPNGWYSVDGEDKNQCVMELGQTRRAYDNYRDCTGQKMDRGVFN
jgi:hypothetical protein